MAERRQHVVSSAVVQAFPEHVPDVVRRIGQLPETEVPRFEGSRIVVVMEGATSGVVGARLAEIALMDGVLSASMVFEHTESLDGDEHDTQPS